MRFLVSQLPAFHAESFAAAGEVAEKVANLVVNRFFMPAIADEACEGSDANCASLVVSVVVLEVVAEVFFGGKDFRTEVAVELAVDFFEELIELELRLPFRFIWPSCAAAFEMTLKLRGSREAQLAFFAVDWRGFIVSSVQVVVQRDDGRVEDIRAGFFVRARNFVIHVDCSHVSLYVGFVFAFRSAQVASRHLSVGLHVVNAADVVFHVALLSERLSADLKKYFFQMKNSRRTTT